MTNINEIINKYQYDRSIRKYNDKHFYDNGNDIFRRITSKKDVNIAKNHVISRIDEYKNATYKLVEEDILDIERAIGQYEIAVKKVIQCYGYKDFDFNYSAEELQSLIDKIFEFHERLKDVSLKKAYQD